MKLSYILFSYVVFQALALSADVTGQHDPKTTDFYSIRVYCKSGHSYYPILGYRAAQNEEEELLVPSYSLASTYYIPSAMFNNIKSYCYELLSKNLPNVSIAGSNVKTVLSERAARYEIKPSLYWGPNTEVGVISPNYYDTYKGYYITPSFQTPKNENGYFVAGTKLIANQKNGELRHITESDWSPQSGESFEAMAKRNLAMVINKDYNILFIPTGQSKTLQLETAKVIVVPYVKKKTAEELFEHLIENKNVFKPRKIISKQLTRSVSLETALPVKIIDYERPETFMKIK